MSSINTHGPAVCLSVYNNEIAVGCYSGTFHLFQLDEDTNSLNMYLTAKSHRLSDIKCIQLSENMLATGSVDTKINIWKRSFNKQWSLSFTLIGHSGPITTLKFDEYKVFDTYKNIRIFIFLVFINFHFIFSCIVIINLFYFYIFYYLYIFFNFFMLFIFYSFLL